MNTLIGIVAALASIYAAYRIVEWFDRGPVNGSCDLPDPRVRNTNNLDWTENIHKWDEHPPVTEDPLLFDLDPKFADEIRRRIKR